MTDSAFKLRLCVKTLMASVLLILTEYDDITFDMGNCKSKMASCMREIVRPKTKYVKWLDSKIDCT